jgi:hypothetical protein
MYYSVPDDGHFDGSIVKESLIVYFVGFFSDIQ